MAQKEYSNGKVTVVWNPTQCIHSTKCFKGLPDVFDPNTRPWVNIEGAVTQNIIDQVKRCPSGALSYYMNDGSKVEKRKRTHQTEVEVTKNGPLLVKGVLKIKMPNGKEEEKSTMTAFCRCGASANKPFCDGSHKHAGFEG